VFDDVGTLIDLLFHKFELEEGGYYIYFGVLAFF
jgi:hypothetical protein